MVIHPILGILGSENIIGSKGLTTIPHYVYKKMYHTHGHIIIQLHMIFGHMVIHSMKYSYYNMTCTKIP